MTNPLYSTPSAPAKRRAVRAVLATVLLGALVAGLAELFVPSIVERQVRDRLEGRFGGSLDSLEIDSSPALATVIGGPDRIAFEMESGTVEGGGGGEGFEALTGVDEVEARFGTLSLPAVEAHDVVLAKDGDRFHGTLEIPRSFEPDARGALDGQAFELSVAEDGRLQTTLTGLGIPVEVVASEGQIVARPEGAGPLISALGSRSLVRLPTLSIDQFEARESGERIVLDLSGEVVGTADQPEPTRLERS